MIKTYRKKPVEIEAVQWNGANLAECKEFCDEEIMHCPKMNKLLISTLEGDMYADINDYIIKGVKGEFYPCKPDVFESTYEEVEGDK